MRRTRVLLGAGATPEPPEKSAGRTSVRVFVLCCLAAAGLFAVFVFLLWRQPYSSRTGTNAVNLALALAVVVTCGRTARLARGDGKRIWSLLTAAAACWTVGQGLLLWPGLTPESLQDSIVGSAFGLALVPLVWALCTVPPEHSERPQRIRFWLGASIVVASVVLFCRTVVLNIPPPTVLDARLGPTVQLASCTAYVSLSCLVWIVLLRAGTKGRVPLFLVSAGLIAYAWANAHFVYRSGLRPGPAQDLLTASSAWCYLMFILAAVSPSAAGPRLPSVGRARGRYVGLHSLLVYVPVVMACVVAVAAPGVPDSVVIVSGALVLILFGVRQMLLLVDNNRLAEDLEARVDDLVQRSSELRRLGLQNQRIVQSVVDGVIEVNAAGEITFANPAAAVILRRSREDLLGRTEEEIVHPQARATEEVVESVVRSAMRAGKASVSANEHFVAGDGHIFPVELAVGPILEDDRITGAVVVFRDVSERRKVEKMKSEFVSVVSHELRTPLTAIRGSLGLLAGGAAGLLSPNANRMVGVALESSDRLTRLVNDMLDIERIESGTMPVQLSDHQPRALVEAAVDSIRGLAGNHRITINADVGLPLVRADSDRIVQALTNLIGNAVKFSPPLTTITISVTERTGFVDFCVTDQGRGVPADRLSRIFERFEQVDSSDSREKGGSGLGLAISRTIVRRHGGELTVTSTVGVGSSFRFNIPTSGGEAGVLSVAAASSLPVAGSAAVEPGGAPAAPAARPPPRRRRSPGSASSG